MKNILVIYYSQTGQLKEIADKVVEPLKENHITYLNIQPENPFPFPWNNNDFFNAFPETFTEKSIVLKPIPEEVLQKKYDLIVFAYQIWFLSPSLPVSSFLKLPEVATLFNNTPVVTVIGCRNMWVLAHERMKAKLKSLNAKYVGNIVLRDRNPNHISVLTIVHWLFYGKKTRMFGFMPLPGVSDTDIQNSKQFGFTIKESLDKNDFSKLQERLINQKAVEIKPFLLTVEQKATKIFSIWSSLILKNQSKRRILLHFFNFYLWFAIWVISPLVFLIYLLLYFFRIQSLKKQIQQYQSI